MHTTSTLLTHSTCGLHAIGNGIRIPWRAGIGVSGGGGCAHFGISPLLEHLDDAPPDRVVTARERVREVGVEALDLAGEAEATDACVAQNGREARVARLAVLAISVGEGRPSRVAICLVRGR